MLGLQSNPSLYKLTLPKEFLVPEIQKKYYEILKNKKGFFNNPIDFLNESIQRVEVFGVTNAALEQPQPGTGVDYTFDKSRIVPDSFTYPHTQFKYRAAQSPLALLDMTMNIEFRHSLGYLNYLMVFENFWYLYSRDTYSNNMVKQFNIDILNEIGEIYSRIIIYDPIINGIDMLSLDHTRPIGESQSFKVEFKYSNFEFKFLDIDD